MIKVVLDSNLIVSGYVKPGSASDRIINLCIQKRLLAVYSEKIKSENLQVLERVYPSAKYLDKIKKFHASALLVVPSIKIDICFDRSDNLYFEAAFTAGAEYIITSDRHILEHSGYMGIKAIRPADFLKDTKLHHL